MSTTSGTVVDPGVRRPALARTRAELLEARLGLQDGPVAVVMTMGALHDGHRELIKRVTAVGPGGVTLLGDNRSHSTDARSFGPLPTHAVSWRVVLRYWPPSRVGAVSNSISTGNDPAAHALSESPSAQP